MGITTCLLLAAAAGLPQVEVLTLQGQKHRGAFQELSADSIAVTDTAGKKTGVDLKELMHVTFAKPSPLKADLAKLHVVVLVDGSELVCSEVTTTGTAANVDSPLFGKLRIPIKAVESIRFAPQKPQLTAKWNELRAKDRLKDSLAVGKTNSIDHVGVVIDRVTEKDVHFAFDGRANNLPRSRFFGIVFARDKPTDRKPVCEVRLAGGAGSLRVSRLRWNGSDLTGRLLAGVDVKIPAENVSLLDFSLDKVKYLSDMEPRDVEFTPFFDDKDNRALFRYRRNKTYQSRKLQLGKTVYDRGLWIHSRTELSYRLGGDYRRFRAVVGIDYEMAKDGKGSVYLVISGDGKPLFEGHVRGTESPRELDLDVSGVRELTILVDYGENNSVADHLDLCEARVIK